MVDSAVKADALASKSSFMRYVTFVPITGDLKDVFIMKTQISLLIDTQSSLTQNLRILEKTIKYLNEFANRRDDLATILLGIRTILLSIGTTRPYSNSNLDYFILNDDENYPYAWKILSDNINHILDETNIKISLSENIEDIIGGTQNQFDATRYWMNWNRNAD